MSTRAALLLLFPLSLVACGDGTTGTPSDAPASDTMPLCTHIQNLRLYRGSASTFGTTAGARFDGTVCVEGRADIACATPAADKTFELCVPSSGDFGLRFAASGFERTVYLLGPQSTAMTSPFAIADNGYASSVLWIPSGGAYPPTTLGHLVVRVSDAANMPIPDAEVAILPSAGLDVVYLAASGQPDTARTTTSAAGIALVPNVMPIDYDLQVNSTTHPSCAFKGGGHASPDNSQDARVHAIAGTTVVATIECTP